MTARALLSHATLARYALIAKAQGVVVTIAMPDGTTCTIAPVGDKPKADDFDMVDMRR